MTTPIYPFLVSSYAMNVYLYGNRTFEGVPEAYHEPVKKYAAADFSYSRIKEALDNGYITQQEFDDTLAYKYPDGVPEGVQSEQEAAQELPEIEPQDLTTAEE